MTRPGLGDAVFLVLHAVFTGLLVVIIPAAVSGWIHHI